MLNLNALYESAKAMSRTPVAEIEVDEATQLALDIAQTWQVRIDPGELLGYSALVQERVRQDKRAEQSREGQYAMLSLFLIPGVLDQCVLRGGQAFTQKMNAMLFNHKSSFLNLVFAALWNRETGERICSIETVNWLFTIAGIRNLGFITMMEPVEAMLAAQEDDVTDGDFEWAPVPDLFTLGILKHISQSGDQEVITRLFEANETLPHRPLYAALTRINSVDDLENLLVALVQHPDFDYNEYSADASDAFQDALTEIQAALTQVNNNPGF